MLLVAGLRLVVWLTQLHFEGADVPLAGTTDIDAITLSMASYPRNGGDAATAAGPILVATLTNTLVKCSLVVVLGSTPLRGRVLAATAGILAAGLTVPWASA